MITIITPIILKCLIPLIMDLVFVCLHYTEIKKVFLKSNILRIIRLHIAYLRTKNTNVSNMFCNCNSLTNLDMSRFNTDKVTDMSAMFDGCSLENLDLNSYFSE